MHIWYFSGILVDCVLCEILVILTTNEVTEVLIYKK